MGGSVVPVFQKLKRNTAIVILYINKKTAMERQFFLLIYTLKICLKRPITIW